MLNKKFSTFLVACVWNSACLSTESHRVEVFEGDSLWSIAKRYGTTVEEIEFENELWPNMPLLVGQVLRVETKLASSQVAWVPFLATPKSRRKGSSKRLKRTIDYKSFPKGKFGLRWPAIGRVSSEFGYRRGRLHKGIDIAANWGSPIRAIASGTVTFSGHMRGYGKTVIVRHHSYITLYAHCSRLHVNTGDKVDSRVFIGEVGTTGKSTGPHLHFEYRDLNNRAKNPRFLLGYPQVKRFASL